ncbi:MAG: LAGLIDADG family homing endonuclease [Thermoprotei archaeon]
MDKRLANLWWFKGKPHPNLGKHLSAETKRKIAKKNELNPNLSIEKMPYLIGAFLGDGNININKKKGNYQVRFFIGLNPKNLEFENAIQMAIRKLGLHSKAFYTKGKKKCIVIITYSKKLCMFFKRIKKNLNLLNPMLQNQKWLQNFVTGFYDAEGTYNKANKLVSMSNTNRELITFVKKALEVIGFNSATIYVVNYKGHPSWQPLYRIQLNKKAESTRFIKMVSLCRQECTLMTSEQKLPYVTDPEYKAKLEKQIEEARKVAEQIGKVNVK